MHKILLQVLPIASAILVCHAIDSYKASAETKTVEVSLKQTIANINSHHKAELLLLNNSSDRYTTNNTSIGTEADLAARPTVEIPETAGIATLTTTLLPSFSRVQIVLTLMAVR